MAGVAVGLAIEQAKDLLANLARACPSVDTVLVGGPRELPKTAGNVYLQSTQSVTSIPSRGGLQMQTFDLRLMIEGTAPFKRAPAQIAADQAQHDEASRLRWDIASELATAVDEHRRTLRVVDSDLVVTAEDSGFVDNQWVARAWCVVRCYSGPVR